jgi:glucan phosphoethanolaminetransferase (alkaline phosphatase superfamily)
MEQETRELLIKGLLYLLYASAILFTTFLIWARFRHWMPFGKKASFAIILMVLIAIALYAEFS